jgi:hypothetical protein
LHNFFKRCYRESDIATWLRAEPARKFQFAFLAEATDCLKSNLRTAITTHNTTDKSNDSHTANTTALKLSVL